MFVLLLLTQPLPHAIPNQGFEADAERLVGWQASSARGYAAVVATDRSYAGGRHALLAYRARNAADRGSAPALTTRIDARRYRGRTVRVTAAVRLGAAGYGSLTVAAEAARAGETGFQGDTWQRIGVDLPVPARARSIVITFGISPGNDLEIDDVRLERRR